mmetsp:Transcript_13658/g.43599  ORF Transcript_13658/g.43599 Transcript_13658/m.43599 type:complete len:249 (+) Transcript_13658:164-910(+)
MSVELGKAVMMVCCTSSWVRGSIAEVASSSSKSGGCRRTIRARHMSCRWPKLRFVPSSEIWWKRRESQPLTTSAMPASSNAFHMRPSEYIPKGSRLYFRLPEKRTGSCGTRPSDRRSVTRPTSRVSTPLRRTRPARGSNIRRSTNRRLDFPQPVVPVMLTFILGSKLMLMPFSTSRGMSAYPAFKFSMTTPAPSMSQPLCTSSITWSPVPQRSSRDMRSASRKACPLSRSSPGRRMPGSRCYSPTRLQ